MRLIRVLTLAMLTVAPALAQQTSSGDPFPSPIAATEGVISVNFVEFASIPDVGTEAPRMMILVDGRVHAACS